jgi:hypothetical protein
MESSEGRIFGATEYTEQDLVQDWRTLGREELIRRAIVSLDGARMEAEDVRDEHYVRHVETILFPFLEAELEKQTGAADSWLTPEERAHYDAKANEEAWNHAIEILEPMAAIARVFGAPELMQVLDKAQDEALGELNRALDVLGSLEERRRQT